MSDLAQLKTNIKTTIQSAIVGLNQRLVKAVYDYEPFLTDENVAISTMIFGFSREMKGLSKQYNVQVIVKIPLKENVQHIQKLSDDLLVLVDAALLIDPMFGDTIDHTYIDGCDVSAEGENTPVLKQIWSIRAVEWEQGLGRVRNG